MDKILKSCKCGSKKFFIEEHGSQTGLYCTKCGKWQKWLNKDEIRVFKSKEKCKNSIHAILTIETRLQDYIDFLDKKIDQEVTKIAVDAIEYNVGNNNLTHYIETKKSLINILEGKTFEGGEI